MKLDKELIIDKDNIACLLAKDALLLSLDSDQFFSCFFYLSVSDFFKVMLVSFYSTIDLFFKLLVSTGKLFLYMLQFQSLLYIDTANKPISKLI